MPNVPSSLVGNASNFITFITSAVKFATLSVAFRAPVTTLPTPLSIVSIAVNTPGVFFKFSSYLDLVLVGALLSPPAAADFLSALAYPSAVVVADAPGLTPCDMSFAAFCSCLFASPVINGVRITRFAAAFISPNLFCTAIIALVAPLRACCSS